MAAPLDVTLYRKAGCGLCDQAEAMLTRLSGRFALNVSTVDIDQDPELQARYFLEIPVITAAGEEVARAPISEAVLSDAFERVAPRRR